MHESGIVLCNAFLHSMNYIECWQINIEIKIAVLKFYYYLLGDKLWGDYGFKDAFSLQDIWFADSYLAIDEGPIIGMIENYRTGLLWNLFTTCPEIKSGMTSLGFNAPYL